MKISLITFILVAALTPIFTLAYSVVGLIIAFLIANTIGISYGAFYARRKYAVQFDLAGTAKILFVSLVCVVPLIAVRYAALPIYLTLVLGAGVYLAVYLTLLPLSRVLTAGELKLVNGVLQKIRFLKLIGKVTVNYELKLCQTRMLVKNKLEALL
jgi:peptidoglycan biosynthesis protein MviN/MurJ (putative lipid II flippase)